MPPNDSFQERTEKATPKRREEARKEGNVVRSMEVNSALVLLIGTLTLYFLGSWLISRIQYGMVTAIKESSKLTLSVESLENSATMAIRFLAEIVAPVTLIILLFGVASNVMQVGFLFTLKPLEPKLSKLNPIEGVKRLVSLRSIVELLKGILKVTIVGYFAYKLIKVDFDQYYSLMDSAVPSIMSITGKLMFKLVLKITLMLLILALFDYFYQKWEYERNMRMSKQDIKDEFKQAEGDPFVKRKIRIFQRQLLMNAMIKELPEADVVVTNPVHLAVALKYDSKTMRSPKVVAKGARKMAERIKKIAEQHNIPIVENKELAQALYKAIDVGMEIPEKFYQAVAEVLSYVYKLKNKRFV